MASFNNGDNEARDVDLTFRCHLNNIVSDSIFYDSMGQAGVYLMYITWCLFAIFYFCFFLLEGVITINFIIAPMGEGKR